MTESAWESAVAWYRTVPGNQDQIRANYFDADAAAAASRFAASAEFQDTLALLPCRSGQLLDLGAGAGIASYAFADRGFSVVALEPDPSAQVGAGAIQHVARTYSLGIHICEAYGEQLPFRDGCFDVIYGRQVLHHAHDLPRLCLEAARVLKPGGTFVAVREHVIRQVEDLSAFLKAHPLHHRYGGENAFTLNTYIEAIADAGLQMRRIVAPYDSIVNFYPRHKEDVYHEAFLTMLHEKAIKRGSTALWRVLRPAILRSHALQRPLLATMNRTTYYPGITYSFVASKA